MCVNERRRRVINVYNFNKDDRRRRLKRVKQDALDSFHHSSHVAASRSMSTADDACVEHREQPDLPLDALELERRLRRNDDERKRRAEIRKAIKTATTDPRENAEEFLATHEAGCRACLRAMRELVDGTSASAVHVEDEETEKRREALMAVNADARALDRALAEASYYLTAYDARARGRAMTELREEYERCAAVVTPRARFRFKSRGREARAGASTNASANSAQKEDRPSSERRSSESGGGDANVNETDDGPGVRDRVGETVVIRDVDESEDFVLERCADCEIVLLGCARALRAYDLRRCRIYVACVAGSAHVENLVDCVVCVAARQLRVHAARRVRFHVRTSSRPIVEDSRDVGFAPLVVPTDDAFIRETLKARGFDQDTGAWKNVDDFKWLKASQSPNWRLLEENEYRADADAIVASVRKASSSTGEPA